MFGISASVILGIILGLFFKNETFLSKSNLIVDIGLCLLLFFVGIDIGKNSNFFVNLKSFGKKIWLLPFSTLIGTLLGGAISSFFINMKMTETILISSGLGWYSLSAIEISKVDPRLGSLAFLSNVFREVLAIVLIPYISKKLGGFESISAAGAPAMDTVLPIISKFNTPDIAIASFFSGVILTGAVPILVPLLISLFNIG